MNIENCDICPRNCQINRLTSNKGYCRSDAGYYISSIFAHKGEEPIISGKNGICNVFFAHCNLQCVYCQNYQISRNKTDLRNFKMSKNEVVSRITDCLNKNKTNIVGFVSPSHFVPQMIEIIEELHNSGIFPTIVYNTNAYDSIETLKEIEKYVDVYLPDLKYAFADLGRKYSKAADYPEIAFGAIKEMFRQKGDFVNVDKNGYIETGLIIRHLILPNNVENSLEVLRFIAEELSSDVYISLMSQYYPTADAHRYPELSRPITKKEYIEVVEFARKLNLTNGWVQDLSSNEYYLPDFDDSVPFKE